MRPGDGGVGGRPGGDDAGGRLAKEELDVRRRRRCWRETREAATQLEVRGKSGSDGGEGESGEEESGDEGEGAVATERAARERAAAAACREGGREEGWERRRALGLRLILTYSAQSGPHMSARVIELLRPICGPH